MHVWVELKLEFGLTLAALSSYLIILTTCGLQKLFAAGQRASRIADGFEASIGRRKR